MDGVLIVDKPAGLTSADVIRKLKRLVKPNKIGHAGTLDPDATGVLIVLIGKATRLQSHLLESDKSYEGVIRLGIATDTDDISGRILEEQTPPAQDIIQNSLLEAVRRFSGTIEQIPPKFSAVKIDGRRAYDLARTGETFETKARTVRIANLELSLVEASRLAYRVTCSSGTYVRSLARDIGQFLGTFACAESIRRTASGNFNEKDALPLDRILDMTSQTDPLANSRALYNVLHPLSSIIAQYPQFTLSDDECARLRQGNQSSLSNLPISQGTKHAAALNHAGELVAILKVTEHEQFIMRLEIAFVI